MKKRLVAISLTLIATLSLITTVYADDAPGLGGGGIILPTSIELPCPDAPETDPFYEMCG